MQVADAFSIMEKHAGDIADAIGGGRGAVALFLLRPHANGFALNGEVLHIGIAGLLDDTL